MLKRENEKEERKDLRNPGCLTKNESNEERSQQLHKEEERNVKE